MRHEDINCIDLSVSNDHTAGVDLQLEQLIQKWLVTKFWVFCSSLVL